jgi:hypothetical protein
MLSAEAARLAALEALCPKAALDGDANYPTLAGHRVWDSRLTGIDDLDPDAKFTPCLALFTAEADATLRGDGAAFDDTETRATLEIVAELSVASNDEAGAPYADAMAADDWDARLVLAAMCAQVRRTLLYSPQGYPFRQIARRVIRWHEETFAIPQLGARWHRVTIRAELAVQDDVFADAAGLPEPIKSLAAALPAGSAATAKLAVLATHFAAIPRDPLAGADFADAAANPKIRLTADMEQEE